MRYFKGKGKGVIASKNLEFGQYVIEYTGELIDLKEAGKREEVYAADENIGCYMYYFNHRNTTYW